MAKPSFTQAEYEEFIQLRDLTGSYNQVERVTGRLRLPAFVEKHGRDKCDAMLKKFLEKGNDQ